MGIGLSISCSNDTAVLPVEYVDPFIGTGGHGHTHPAAIVPFGMIQPGPVNGTPGWDWVSGYNYADSIITGFAQTHLSGTGIGDLNDILIMPITWGYSKSRDGYYEGKRGYASKFSHEQEEATAGYYKVLLEDTGIWAEMTATERVALYKFTYPDSANRFLVVDLGYSLNWDSTVESSIQPLNDSTMVGYRKSQGWARDQRVYFAMRFSKPFTSFNSIVDKDGAKEGDTPGKVVGKDISTNILFGKQEEPISVKIAISGVSVEGALSNLETLTHWDFDNVRSKAEEYWNRDLNVIAVEGNETKKHIFYTALYHSLQAPHLFSDADGGYRGADGETYTNSEKQRYTIYSLWDTFRAQHPLLTIVQPDRVDDMISTMLDYYKEYGYLPVWELHGNETNTMTGYHAVPVVVDAYLKGFRGFDSALALEAVKASAMQDQRGTALYRKHQYIPSELEVESVTKTLEYAFDDWSIAQLAGALGESEDEANFMERAAYWENVFDKDSGFMRGKSEQGEWITPFDPYRSNHRVNTDYTEGNAWQHSWFVPHQVDKLIERFGGDDAFVNKLDSLFTVSSQLTGENTSPDISGLIGQYAHGNEPSHHIAYLYNYAGQPWKTQEIVHQILTTMYTDEPDGLSGNEDVGQMSAWYVFSAMGLYPVNPVSGVYAIGTPLFEKTKVNIRDGVTFTIEAKNVSDTNIYIQSATLNGKPFDRSYITHKELTSGGSLVFTMGDAPNKTWATSQQSRPINSSY